MKNKIKPNPSYPRKNHQYLNPFDINEIKEEVLKKTQNLNEEIIPFCLVIQIAELIVNHKKNQKKLKKYKN